MLPLLTVAAARAMTPVPASEAAGTIDGAGADRFGYQVTSGDLDHDGVVDLVVSAPHPDANRVYVFFGPIDLAAGPHLDTSLADVVFEGPAGSEAGWSVAVGDVIGGPGDDLVVGAPSQLGGAGQVFVVAGPLGGAPVLDTSAVDLVIDGEPSVVRPGYAGWSVATGDWDGDGKDELAIGACYLDPGSLGAAYLVDADVASSPMSVTAATTKFGGLGLTGCSLADLGDLDGDGFDDLGIGSHGAAFPANVSFNGDLSIVYGRPQFEPYYVNGGVEEDIALVVGEGSGGGNFAYDIAAAGDLNRDGYDDVLIGAPARRCDGCVSREHVGRMYVLLGGPSTGPKEGRYLAGVSRIDALADMIYEAPANDEQVGVAVSAAGAAGDRWGKFSHPIVNYALIGPTLLAGSATDQAWVIAYDNRDRLLRPPVVTCEADPETGVLTCEDLRLGIPAARGWRIDLGTARGVHRIDGDPGSALGSEVHGPGDLDGDGLADFVIGADHQLEFGEPAGDGEVLLFQGQ
ncbi:MAG: hypothetical protein R3F59_11735 [Myxococcota bacterium]